MSAKYKLQAISPEGLDKYWSGTGWVDKTDKVYTMSEADEIERDINREGVWCCMKEKA